MARRSTEASSRLTTPAGCNGRRTPHGESPLHRGLLAVVGPATVLAVLLAAEWGECAPARFYAVKSCRIADTRTPTNAPALAAASTRSFTFAGACGISPTASAVAVNVTVTGSTAGGHIRLFPKGQALPGSSALNYSKGQTRANNATVGVGADGWLSVFSGQATGSVHVILDVSGYFDLPANNQPPVVTAGPSQAITLPASASLTGAATDDGKPSGTLTYAWSKVSGPGGVTFSAPGSLTTSATFASSGTYVVRLSASDSLLSGSADVTVEVRLLLGELHTGGQYHLGPVDFAETEWHNACAPDGGYRQSLRQSTGLGGEYLAGVSNDFNGGGGVCDSCIRITTGTGRSLLARVVTYGVSNSPNDLDVSPSVYQALHTGEYPRTMSWQFTACPDTGPLYYEFQTGAHADWTSFWVRNQRVPVTKVEVVSVRHASLFTLRREMDGTLNDDGGFGAGAFTLRITGMDGQVLTETIPSFEPGQLITSAQQFQ